MEKFGHKSWLNSKTKRRAYLVAEAFQMPIETKTKKKLGKRDMGDLRDAIEHELGDLPSSWKRSCELLDKLTQEFQVFGSFKRLL